MNDQEVIAEFKALVAALHANTRRDVNRIALKLVEANPAIGSRWKTLSTLMQTNGENRAAATAMERYVAHAQGDPQAKFEYAALLAQTGRLQDAWTIMQSVPANIPDPAGHAFVLGSMSVNIGDIAQAQEHLLRALEVNPALGQAMLSLAVSEKMTPDSKIGNRIIDSAPLFQAAPDLERGHYHYALGKVHFDRHEADPSFTAFSTGAAIVRKSRPFDPAEDQREADLCRAEFSVDAIADVACSVAVDTSRPIFVTGLPRSGTTLVEQILVSHSSVSGGEELGRMSLIQRDAGGPNSAALKHQLKTLSATELANEYLQLSSERFGDTSRFVDKSLGTSRQIGFITSLLPQAPIIWLRRDPLDCAWSAFRTYFMRGLDWSWNLEDIARHFKLEDDLFSHWTQLLGDKILVVNYEELVSNPEPGIRRILAHCGLDEEPAVFAPHKTRRAVTTASVMQVRQPINTGAIDAAGPYRKHLQPFIDAYGYRGRS